MFWFKRVQHSQAQSFVRGPTQHTLAASAALPNSGNAAFDNAQGASAATASFSRELGAGIGDVVLDGDPADALKSQLHGLAKKAARFVNARPTFFANRAPWTGTRHDAVTITVAYECAAAIYEPGHWPGVQEWGLGFEHEVYRLPSADGSAKATGFSRIWELDVGGEKNPYFPALVVAVRGTGSRVDHIVNLNGRMQDARAFLDPNFTRLHADVGGGPHAAHAGFLNGAVALLPEVTRRVNALVGEKPGPRNIMFTGHSAGGAVASLLFTRFMMEASEKYRSVRFSLITFGAPPVVSPSLGRVLVSCHDDLPTRGLLLAFVNAFDMVTRADPPYIRSLVQLFKRACGSEDDFAHLWPVPNPDFWPLGGVVVMWEELERERDNGQGGLEGREDHPSAKMTKKLLRIEKVPTEEFVKALFCRIDVHKRDTYRRRIQSLAKGVFNERDG